MACSIAPFGELGRGKKMIVKTQMIMFSATFLRIDYLISQTSPSSPSFPALLYPGGNSSALIWLVVLRHFIWRHKSINAPWATRAHAQTQQRAGTEGGWAEGYLPDSICTWELLIGSATDQTRLRPRKIYGWLQPQVELSWEHFKFMIRKSDCFIVCEMDRWSPECAVKGGRQERRRSPLELGLNWIACMVVVQHLWNSFIFMICELRFMMMLFVELLHFYGLS